LEESLSACDYDEEFDKKLDIIDDKKKPKLGFFDKSEYF
jgi:hypothetical protein